MKLPDYAHGLLGPSRYKTLRGGRGGAKSHTFALLSILRMIEALPGYRPGPVRIASLRQFLTSIRESSKKLVEMKIRENDLEHLFTIHRDRITSKNGSEMIFAGLARGGVDSLRSAEAIDIAWTDEAHKVEHEEAQLLVPTIRAPGSELWFSWNPHMGDEWVHERFVEQPRPNDVSFEVSYMDNPFWNDVLEEERASLEREDPMLYRWVYEGELLPSEGSFILPAEAITACVRPPLTPLGSPIDIGVDLAFTGEGDQFAVVARRGSDVVALRAWTPIGFEGDCQRVHRFAEEVSGGRLRTMYWDSTGSHPFTTEMRRCGATYAIEGVNFGAGVAGGAIEYEPGITNREQFMGRNAQLLWALRLRVMRALSDFGNQRPDVFLLTIPPDLPERHELVRQARHAIWTVEHGKVVVDKMGRSQKSPDLLDALSLAFTADSRRGLRARPVTSLIAL